MDLLALNQSPDARVISYDDSELPSWAPNWDSRIYRPCGGYTKDGCYQASGLEKPRIDFRNLPTGSTSLVGRVRRSKSCYHFHIQHRVLPGQYHYTNLHLATGLNYFINASSQAPILLTAGCTIDEIAKVGTPWTPNPGDYTTWAFDQQKVETYFSEIHEFCKQSDLLNHDIYQNPQMRKEAHWRIPSANIRHQQNVRCKPSSDGAELKECYDLLIAGSIRGNDERESGLLAEYHVALGGLFKRRPFLSKHGHVGVVPSYA